MYIDDSLEVADFLAEPFDFVGFLFIFPPLESFAAFELDLTEKQEGHVFTNSELFLKKNY